MENKTKTQPVESLGTPLEELIKRVELEETLTKSSETMSEKKGVKQTKDIVRAVRVLAVAILEEVLDGVSPMDAIDIAMNSEVRDSVAEAMEGIEKVDEEIGDLSTEEVFEIVREGVDLSEDVLKKILN